MMDTLQRALGLVPNQGVWSNLYPQKNCSYDRKYIYPRHPQLISVRPYHISAKTIILSLIWSHFLWYLLLAKSLESRGKSGNWKKCCTLSWKVGENIFVHTSDLRVGNYCLLEIQFFDNSICKFFIFRVYGNWMQCFIDRNRFMSL